MRGSVYRGFLASGAAAAWLLATGCSTEATDPDPPEDTAILDAAPEAEHPETFDTSGPADPGGADTRSPADTTLPPNDSGGGVPDIDDWPPRGDVVPRPEPDALVLDGWNGALLCDPCQVEGRLDPGGIDDPPAVGPLGAKVTVAGDPSVEAAVDADGLWVLELPGDWLGVTATKAGLLDGWLYLSPGRLGPVAPRINTVIEAEAASLYDFAFDQAYDPSRGFLFVKVATVGGFDVEGATVTLDIEDSGSFAMADPSTPTASTTTKLHGVLLFPNIAEGPITVTASWPVAETCECAPNAKVLGGAVVTVHCYCY